MLGPQEYICGQRMTLLDIRLFETLIRFDIAYASIFKCNRRSLHSFKNIARYVRNLYHGEYRLGERTHEDHIKRHYFKSYPKLNPGCIMPFGPEPWWRKPNPI